MTGDVDPGREVGPVGVAAGTPDVTPPIPDPGPRPGHDVTASGEAAPGPAPDAGGQGQPCAVCGEALVPGAKFCEACGASADATASPADAPAFGAGADPVHAGADAVHGGADAPGGDEPAASPASSADDPAGQACAKCGGAVADDGYCTSCGHRALEEATIDDRGDMAYATHRGRRHPRNEDSAALAVTSEGWPVLVVSDGVSVSPNPHRASGAAVAAAAARLSGRAFTGPDDLVAAVAEAHEAVSAVPGDDDPYWTPDGSHPACTIVVAVAAGDAVHVANVGDARAHLLRGEDGSWVATQISTDDSVAAQAVAQGIELEIALNLPGGHGITAWLGGDAGSVEPHVTSVAAAPGDVLLASSDGLWNYAPTDAAMGALVTTVLAAPGTTPIPPAGPCARLVDWANDQGGADNITVAITPLHTELEDNA